MIPLMIAGAIWGHNAVKFANLAARNKREMQRHDVDEFDAGERLPEIQNEGMRPESGKHGVNFNDCTFNIYIKGGGNGRERFID